MGTDLRGSLPCAVAWGACAVCFSHLAPPLAIGRRSARDRSIAAGGGDLWGAGFGRHHGFFEIFEKITYDFYDFLSVYAVGAGTGSNPASVKFLGLLSHDLLWLQSDLHYNNVNEKRHQSPVMIASD